MKYSPPGALSFSALSFSALSFGALSVVAGALLSANAAADEPRVGTYVARERPIYLEIDRLVAGEPCRLEIKNLPEGAQQPVLFFSPAYRPVDMSYANIPGVMGPDLVKGSFKILPGAVYETVAEKNLAGQKIYLQVFVGTKKGKRLSNMVEAVVREANFDAGGDDDKVSFPLKLITQEILPTGRPAFDRTEQHVRVGVPLPRGQVWETRGVPELTVRGPTPAAQFTTMARWTDGSVKWALAEYQGTVKAGVVDRSFTIDRGAGNFGGPDLCSVSGQRVTVDTGVLHFVIDGSTVDLFESLDLNGEPVLDTSVPNRFRFLDKEGARWTYHPMQAVVRSNGPVRCEIQVDGKLTASSSASDQNRVYLRCYVEAFKNSKCLRVRTSLRNTSVGYPYDLEFRALSYDARLKSDGPFDVRLPKPSTNGETWDSFQGSLTSAGELANLEMGFVRNTNVELTDDYTSSMYTPFIERLSGTDQFAVEGVCARINETFFTGDYASGWFSDETEYCDPFFIETNSKSTGKGLLFGVQQANATWPVRLQANFDGDVQVELFPQKTYSDSSQYPLTYATCETRSFLLIPESQPAWSPHRVIAACDYPLGARGELWVYNQSKVWPWHLVSLDDAQQFAAHAGLPDPWVRNMNQTRTLFRYAGGTGGENNNWRATQAFNQYLRTGHGGAWFRAAGEALYKADKMAVTLDDASLDQYQPPLNEGTATKHGKFWDGSKHTYLQAVPDVAFAFGDLSVLDGAPHLAATILEERFTSSQPYGNFVPGTYGAVTASATAVLQAIPHPALFENTHKIFDQWANIVFQEKNDLGVDATTKGWQAMVGTPTGTSLDPDGYFITKAGGKSSDWEAIGYQTQIWVDGRVTAHAYSEFIHLLREVDPNDPLIEALSWRARDIYHFARRAAPDDHCAATGDEYVHDVFPDDGGDEAPDKFLGPGDPSAKISQTGYALQGWINFYLDQVESESAYSYGVELARSMSDNTYTAKQDDPAFNEFMYRYLRHYGLIAP